MVGFAAFGMVLSSWLKRLDIVDVLWGLGFGVIGVTSLMLGRGSGPRGMVVTALVLIWGLRLSVHIYHRRRGRPEDHRYVAMKAKWRGHELVNAFVQVFIAQAALALVIMLPVIIVNSTTLTKLNTLDFLGIAVWLVGFGFEAVGDYQLSRFLANSANRGKLMSIGLWRYTRHPNYFGEVTLWWGIFLLALSVPYGLLGVIGPLTISYLILKVSGVPLLERASQKRPGWNEYVRRTSKFIPMLPRD